MKLPFPWLASMLLVTGFIQAQSLDIQVELMNQIGTDTSRKGDLISGRVISPPQLQGDVLEGRITESRSGAKLGGKSVFSFTFDTLRHAGSTIPISSQFKSAINSKGRQDVDEEGRIVRRASGNVAKAAGGTGLGAMIGGIAGGGKGAAIGSVIGAGASIAMVQIAADAPNIRFAPGSRLLIEANARSGAPLSTLAAAQPTPVNAPAPPVAAQPVTTASAAPAPLPAQPGPPQSTPPQPAAAPGETAQPEFKSLAPAFVPGEKTLFYDDFTDMSPGDAPPHFKVRGAAPDLQAAGAVRQLLVTANGTLTPNLTSLPKNFTYEADLKFDGVKRAIIVLSLFSNAKEVFQFVTYAEATQMDLVASMRAPYQELGRKRLPMSWNNVVRFALWVQNGRMRIFVNGEKQLDFNQIDLPPVTRVDFGNSTTFPGQSIGYRMIRFAESAPDFSQMISASGRYVTHGILFDTGSDRLKPESAAVIQTIAKGLETNPNLRLCIEGHTDSVGNAGQNLELSRRRAEAVKTVLSAQFGIDAARLTTAGMGSTKPLETNDTPQGRSQNRRVEFVRQ
ncbi:OmpA family protein [Paludibaculum fermentans]|uniref:OmpA family protein n=1 Tax=Paludibaculum fermentans TaxID=1473598 RepID=A0A7S7NWQ5_PALFE|nr:OmpA family protein [Paludibaculum fermentans]QOY91202.1 OmpA family protein [Paludibaculum fermentans]